MAGMPIQKNKHDCASTVLICFICVCPHALAKIHHNPLKASYQNAWLGIIPSCYRPITQSPQCTIPISHNASFSNRSVYVCRFLLQNGAFWDTYLMHCGICEMDLLPTWKWNMIATWTWRNDISYNANCSCRRFRRIKLPCKKHNIPTKYV